MRITASMTLRLADQIQAEPHLQAELIASAAKAWACHTSTVRRRLREDHGLACGESREETRSYLSDTDCETIAQYLAKSIRKKGTGRVNLTIEQAVELAYKNGALTCDRLPALSTVSRRLRELNISPADLVAPAPHVELRSLHANHVQQLDASLCVQYQFGERGMKIRHVDLNKIDKTPKQAIHRWVMADHATGAFVPMYFDSPGERIEDMLQFLFWAWRPKDDPRLSFSGLPIMLYTDPGTAFRSTALRNLCKAYDIRLDHHEAGRARSTGSVERHHFTFERYFESRLRLEPLKSVEQLITTARLEAMKLCTTRPHSRHGMTRFEAFERTAPQPLRVPVDDYEQFCWLAHGREEEATVDGALAVVVNKRRYRLDPEQVTRKQKIIVRPHPFERGLVRFFASQAGPELTAEVIETDLLQYDVRANVIGETPVNKLPKTRAQRVIEASKDLESIKAFLSDEDMPADVYARPPLQTQVVGPVEAPVDELLDRTDAKLWIVARLGRALTEVEAAWLNTHLPEQLAESALGALYNDFQAVHSSGPHLRAVA